MPFPSLHPDLARALQEQSYAEPTPVQAAVLQPDALDRDLLVSAQTGSGKTVAYGLALASTLLEEGAHFRATGEPQALVVAPTRELALQVHREMGWLYAHTGARVVSCVGGMDIRREQRALHQGADIVVGTPGRLRDHLERGNLETGQLRAVVLDEADEMLDLGFREDLEFLLDAAPADRRTLLFSATLPKDIVGLAKRYQRDAFRIATSVQNQAHGDIEYRAIRIAPNDVEHAVVNVLRHADSRAAMVFCATREAVRGLHGKLLERGFAAVALSGELSQNERTHALQALRDGRARVCVATDVAARGIDLPDLGLVIHTDIPKGRETFQHRSGRTGRAGRKGVSVLLVPHTRRRQAERLLDAVGVDAAWMAPPSAEEIRARDQERLMADIATGEELSEEDRAAVRALVAGRSPEEIAAALVRLYRAALPAPEDMLDGGAPDPQGEPKARNRGPEDTVWFRMNIGRAQNADPRWLLPLICRRGHVTKRDIGAIRIFDRETRFEIARHLADQFTAAIRRPVEEDGNVRIEPARDDAPEATGPAKRPRAFAKPRSGGTDEAGGPARPGKPPRAGAPFKATEQQPGDQKPREHRGKRPAVGRRAAFAATKPERG
ncbi:DEAD/DEAH box helicase [Azospirillum sp. SYSU D00513]|uniref:DEAD/DEAH box helicase n=1 Tax=Azospirillum sp. SYSU D00513 TaxID=2812561 RepID=UPI001A95A0FD|nr:DEAD/DEAH box helicase [Azospirillum sp. SYSU D00513]